MDIMWPTSQSHFHVSFIFIKIIFFHCYFSVIFAMKSINIYNDYVNYDQITINDH